MIGIKSGGAFPGLPPVRRTYPEGQTAAVAGLANVTRVLVRNAGHNLFMSSPEVREAMHRFMRGVNRPGFPGG